MKVSELIEKLSELDQDKEIMKSDTEGFEEILGIRLIDFVKYNGEDVYAIE